MDKKDLNNRYFISGNKILSTFYKKIKRTIEICSLKSNKRISEIIKRIRLKPLGIFDYRHMPPAFRKEWFDEYHHLVLFEKVPKIKYNSLKLKNDFNIKSTDLYKHISIYSCFKIARSICAIQVDNDSYYILMLCDDEYFRCYFYEDYFYDCSSLELGIDNLIKINSWFDQKTIGSFELKGKTMLPLKNPTAWIFDKQNINLIGNEKIQKIIKELINNG